jgi:hypothetical protein
MTIQSKNVAVGVNAAARNQLAKARRALSELASAAHILNDSAANGRRRSPRKRS